MRTPRMLVVGLVFAAALAACSSATDAVSETSPTLAAKAATPEPEASEESAASIRVGELSLTWDEQEVGEGIKPAFAVDKEGIVHVAFCFFDYLLIDF